MFTIHKAPTSALPYWISLKNPGKQNYIALFFANSGRAKEAKVFVAIKFFRASLIFVSEEN
jgi:hypothetical protein